MSSLRLPALPALLALCVALTALAGGASLEPQARALLADHEELADRIAACPNGDCEDPSRIKADFADLELDLADLEADRDELDPCSDCATLDALLEDARDLSASASEEFGGWEQER